MADFTSVRVGELPSDVVSGSDFIPHEVAGVLKKATVSELSAYISALIGTSDAVGFRAVTVTDGQTLPSVTPDKNEFILVGIGTFQNVGGGSPITTTKALNALITSGTTWELGVEIDVTAEGGTVSQQIRSGVIDLSPSENAIYTALLGKEPSLPSGLISQYLRGDKTWATLPPTPTVDQTLIDGSTNAVSNNAVYDAFLLAANQLELKSENSASALSGFEITNNGNGTLNINGGIALLRDQNDPFAILQKYTIPAVTNLAMVDNANNFVLVDYNSGTPAIIVTQNPDTINGRTNSIIAGVSRVGTTLDYISLVGQGVDSWQKIRSRFLDTETVTRAKGLELGASGLAISCTAGVAYAGLNKLLVSALNQHTQAHRTGSTWVRTTGLTNLNNTQYNNAGTLTTMTNGRFRVDYVYVLVDNPSKLYTIMGEVQYNTIADARLAVAPAVLPTELQFLGMRVGRLIVEKSATTVEVSSEFNTVYRAGSVQNHNDLALLNTGNYNHFRATVGADAGKVLSVNSQGVADFATIPKAQFQSGELVDQLTIATATLEERFQLNSQPLVSNKHTFTLASGVVFPVTVHIETKAGSPSGYDGTATITASNNSFANGISPSFSNAYKVYMPNATTLVYEWVAGQEIYDGYWGDKLSLRVPENGVAKALTSKAYVDAGLASKNPLISHLEFNNTDKTVWNNGKGNFDGNTVFGQNALKSNVSANFNTIYGTNVLTLITTGNQNAVFGGGSAISMTTGTANTIVGANSATIFGSAGSAVTNMTSNVLVGQDTRPLLDNTINEIVIGANAIGAGSNTATLGNNSITSTILRGTVSGGSFVKNSAPTTNLLLAGGGDIAQSTFFPAPTGLTTNYLPKWNGTGFGNSQVFDNGSFVTIGANEDLGSKFNVRGTFRNFLTTSDTGDTILNGIEGVSGGFQITKSAGNVLDYKFSVGNGSRAVTINNSGNTLFGTTTDNGVDKVQVNGTISSSQYKVSALNTAPASATATGTTGEIRITSTHIYVCTATNTWVRTALTTW